MHVDVNKEFTGSSQRDETLALLPNTSEEGEEINNNGETKGGDGHRND